MNKPAKFVQITSAMAPTPKGLMMQVFTLDEDGKVWQLLNGRGWKALTENRIVFEDDPRDLEPAHDA